LNQLCIVYALVYVPGAFLTGPIVGRFGTRWTFVMAMVLTLAGCMVRHSPQTLSDFWPSIPGSGSIAGTGIADDNSSVLIDIAVTDPPEVLSFQLLLLGQTLCALGQPLLVNLTSEMGAEWFPPSERPLAAMVSSLMNFIGSSLSFMLPTMIVTEGAQSLERVQEEVIYLLWVHFMLACVAFFLTVALYRPAPMMLNYSAQRAPLPFVSEVSLVLKCRDFWIVNLQFAVFVAIGHGFDAVEGSLLQTYGYSPQLSSWTALSCSIGAVVSTLLESRLIQSATLYKAALKVTHCFMAVSLVIGFMTLHNHWHQACFVTAIGIMGLSTPGWGCSFELGSEVCFPASEATVCSLLEACSNLLGVGFIIGTQYFIDLGSGARVLVYMAFGTVIVGLCLNLLRGELKRSMAEEAEKDHMEVPLLEDVRKDSNFSLEIAGPCKDLPRHLAHRKFSLVSDMGQGDEGFMSHLSSRSTVASASCADFNQITYGANRSWVVFCVVPVFVIVTIITVLRQQAKADGAPDIDQLIDIHNGSPCGARKCLPSKWTLENLQYAEHEPVTYVIKCFNKRGERKKLARFHKYAVQANISAEEVSCQEGTKENVEAAIKEGVVPDTAIDAIGQLDRQGHKRSHRLGSALTHLRLMQKVIQSNRSANVVSVSEILYQDYRFARNELLCQLQRRADFVKLNIESGESGDLEELSSGACRMVHKLSPGLSPMTNVGLSNYFVTTEGAEQVLEAGRTFDTFGKWEKFGQHLLATFLETEASDSDFAGYAVSPNCLSLYCPNGS